MNLAVTKIELAKLLLESNNKDLINHIKAIFESRPEIWWEELPDEIKKKVEKGLKEADLGEGIEHKEVMKSLRKWQKRK